MVRAKNVVVMKDPVLFKRRRTIRLPQRTVYVSDESWEHINSMVRSEDADSKSDAMEKVIQFHKERRKNSVFVHFKNHKAYLGFVKLCTRMGTTPSEYLGKLVLAELKKTGEFSPDNKFS